MNFNQILSTCLVLLYFHCPQGLSQPKPATAKLLHEYLTIQQQRVGFNGVVMVAVDNEIAYQDAVGLASKELNVAITAGSVFPIASITKQFTAFLIVHAVEEGKLTLTDSLIKFFPELTDPQWQKITIHQLLTHTSGLPHNEGIPDYWRVKSFLPLSDTQAMTEILTLKLLDEPGRATQYSSPGYFLLASVLEKVYGESYARIIVNKITSPLGLSNTGGASSRKVIPHLTSGYHLLGDSVIVAPHRDFSLMKGSGDLYASAEDLTAWNNRLLFNTSGAIKAKLFAVQNPQPMHGNKDAYGYGWFIRPGKPGERASCYTGGGTFGCSAISVIYPAEKMSVVVLSNVSALPVNELWQDIEKIVFEEEFALPVVYQALQLTPEHLRQMTGNYVAENGMVLSITQAGTQLRAKLGHNPAFELYAQEPFEFYGRKVAVTLRFRQNHEAKVTKIEVEGRGQQFTFTRR